MGNCGLMRGVVAGGERSSEVVRVVTSSGGVMELAAPVTADAVATSFPGHAVFRCPDDAALLRSNDLLLPGPRPYYLLPLLRGPAPAAAAATPYRVSCEEAEPDALPRFKNRRGSSGGGVWKVKLVISPEQLAEILSQEARTEALIESVRTVAKCRAGAGGASSVAGSDQWSVSGSV